MSYELVIDPVDGPDQINLIPNPGFERDTYTDPPAAWSGAISGSLITATSTLSTARAKAVSGLQSMEVTTPGGASSGYAGAWVDVAVPVSGPLTVSLWVYPLLPGVNLFHVGIMGNLDSEFALTGGWAQCTITTSLTLGTWALYVAVAATVAMSFYVDDVIAVSGSLAAPYFDGDSGGQCPASTYRWNGTPGDSTSQRVNLRTPLALNAGEIAVGSTSPGVGIDWGQAMVTPYEADQRFGSPVVDYRVPNRTVTIPLMLGAQAAGQASFDLARAQLSEKVGLLQREGGWLQRVVPSSAGPVNLYADIVSASLTLPDVWGETGAVEPDVSLALECLPDFYGNQVVLDEALGAGYLEWVATQGGTQAQIAGDYPARTTITVTAAPASGLYERALIWGFRARYYDPAASAALTYMAPALTPISGSGWTSVLGSLADSYDGAIGTAPPANAWTPFVSTVLTSAGTPPLTHQGSYEVWARVYSADATTQIQLGWAQSDIARPLLNAPQTVGLSDAFVLLDLGPIRLDPAAPGDAWWGFIQCLNASGEPVYLDTIWLQPLDESAGVLVAPISDAVYMYLPQDSAYDAVIFYEGELLLRSDGAWRTDDSGVNSLGPVSVQVGDLPRLPPSGLEGRPVQIFAKISQGNLGGSLTGDLPWSDSAIDSLSVQVAYRPCYLFRP